MPLDASEPNQTERQVQATQRYCRVLDELIDIGTELAHLVIQQARTQVETAKTLDELGQQDQGFNVRLIPTPALTQDPIVAYERVTRALRRNITLAQKLHEPPKAPSAPQHRDRTAARKRIIRDVEDTIQRTTKDAEAERLHAEFLDRLDGPDLDDDIDHLPIDEIIKDICRDLGIAHAPGTHPWKRRTPADIAILAARAATKTTEAARASSAPEAPDSETPDSDANKTNPPPQRRPSGSDPPLSETNTAAQSVA